MFKTNQISKKAQLGVRQEFSNKPCGADRWSLAGSPCCFYRTYLGTDTAVRTVRFVLLETHVLPQGSSGTGQYQDRSGGYAAGTSKQDVYGHSSVPTGSHFCLEVPRSELQATLKEKLCSELQLHSISSPCYFASYHINMFHLKAKDPGCLR